MAAEEEFEEEEISKEEKMGILQYFVSNAPPGHQGAVLNAARKLNLSDVIDDSVLNNIFREFNISTSVVVPRKEGGNYVIDSAGEVAGGDKATYKSSATGEIFSVDHVKGCATSVKKDDTTATVEQKAMQDAANAYAAKVFQKGNYAVEVFSKAADTLQVVFSVQTMKIEAYWSGRWQSHYTVKFSGGSGTVSGDTRMLLHYFEGGNVQQNLEKDHAGGDVSYADAASLAKAAMDIIAKAEADLQKSVSTLYQTMEELTRGMRRALPVSKQKFDWVNYAKYQVRDQYGNMTVSHGKE